MLEIDITVIHVRIRAGEGDARPVQKEHAGDNGHKLDHGGSAGTVGPGPMDKPGY